MKNLVFAGLAGWVLLMTMASYAFAGDEGQGADLYLQDVQPMTTMECARCHYSAFVDIRDQGGLHQQPCTDCHQVYHNFKPSVPMKDKLPQCADCHDAPHGDLFVGCLGCHTNAHAPVTSLIGVDKLAKDCEACHGEQQSEIKEFPSAHAEILCSDCHHSRHGNRPSCNECHEDVHTPYIDTEKCVACHAPHSPLEVTYGEETPSKLCSGCHEEVLEALTGSSKKHSVLQCAFCHVEKHGNIPACQDCHESGPHNESMIKKFTGCQDCHGAAHVLKLQ